MMIRAFFAALCLALPAKAEIKIQEVTSPGGITEMSITAKVLQLGVPVVTAFQVCRLVAVLLLVNPLWHWLEARRARDAAC